MNWASIQERLFSPRTSVESSGADKRRGEDPLLFESGDHVIALGTYSGRAKATGRDFTAQFTHVWTLQSGKTVRLQQCADTVQVTRAMAH